MTHDTTRTAPVLRRWLLATLLLLATAWPLAQAAETRLPDAQEARLREMARELRCLVCQNESLAESHAPLAADLREEVRTQIRAGKTNEEIIRYLVDRYGDFVSYRPPLNARTALLWFGPAGILLLLLLAIGAFHRHSRRQRASPLPAQDAREIQDQVHRLQQQYGDRPQ